MTKDNKKIKEEFGFTQEAEAVKEYSSLNRDFMHSNYPLIADEVISRANLEKGSILDIGTGLGSLAFEFAKRLPASRVYGIDISEEMLKEAKREAQKEELSNLEYILGDTHNLDFEDNFFDLIVSFGVLHHLKNLKGAFLEIKRVLKNEACAFIYDLRKTANTDIVSEIASQMIPSQRRAFLESVKEAFDLSYLESVLKNIGIGEYSLASPKYSRKTIIKNRDMLRESKFLGEKFNKIMVEIHFKK